MSFDHDRFDNINAGGFEGRLSIRGQDCCSVNLVSPSPIVTSAAAAVCSDGIQLIGNASGDHHRPWQRVRQHRAGQLRCSRGRGSDVGASNITFTGNYFHNNDDGITNYDPGSSPYTATNNVLVGPFYAGAAGS